MAGNPNGHFARPAGPTGKVKGTVFVSKAVAQAYGYTLAQLKGMPFELVAHLASQSPQPAGQAKQKPTHLTHEAALTVLSSGETPTGVSFAKAILKQTTNATVIHEVARIRDAYNAAYGKSEIAALPYASQMIHGDTSPIATLTTLAKHSNPDLADPAKKVLAHLASQPKGQAKMKHSLGATDAHAPVKAQATSTKSV
ncbi:MAG: hypothetical protein WCG26_01075, partial [Chloroflexales bacterium]